MKKMIAVLFSLAVALAGVSAQANANSEDDFGFTVNDDFTEITITEYKGTRRDVVIPESIQGVPVTRIEEKAFWEYRNSGHVGLPNGSEGPLITHNITSLVIPEGVKVIEADAFYGHRALTSVTLPKGIYVGADAFNGCGLTSLSVPEDAVMERAAFRGNWTIETVSIGENAKIGKNAFEGCCQLKTIAVSKGASLGSRLLSRAGNCRRLCWRKALR